ncbi:hypothetical protein CVT26_000409 [Gymnopilus dilepis]|uniref:RlpA-like protein double-psi beta-barrel domain-containing protein n=1 Tax=Gymnopilus dilepis TaxID=231916 RepID=A0A409X5Z1_9AGAR|nr:hypothetical protein CVT26_000409 [Gymnopilus dilepis]
MWAHSVSQDLGRLRSRVSVSLLSFVVQILLTQGSPLRVEGFVLACGGLFEDFDPVVSLSPTLFGNGAYCGKTIRISSGNKTVNGKVEDICPGCDKFDLDLSPILFEIFAPLSDGLVQVSWTILDD